MMVTSKDAYGSWQAISTKDLPDGRQLKLKTTKHHHSSGSLITTATAYKVVHGLEMWAPFSDFTKRLEQVAHGKVTAKICEEQHSHHDLDKIAEEAIVFYKEREHANISRQDHI